MRVSNRTKRFAFLASTLLLSANVALAENDVTVTHDIVQIATDGSNEAVVRFSITNHGPYDLNNVMVSTYDTNKFFVTDVNYSSVGNIAVGQSVATNLTLIVPGNDLLMIHDLPLDIAHAVDTHTQFIPATSEYSGN